MFKLAERLFAVELALVQRVIDDPALVAVPLTSSVHVGLHDTGEEVVSVFDLAAALSIDRGGEADRYPYVLVMVVEGEALGILIDDVGRIVDAYDLDDADALWSKGLGRTDTMEFIILDADRLFT